MLLIVFYGNDVEFASVFYDFMLHLISYKNSDFSLKQLSQFYDINLYENIDSLFEDIKILHYTFDKPWKYYDIPFAEKWIYYYRKSPFKNEKLNRKSYLTTIYNSKSYSLGRNIAKILHFLLKSNY